MQWQQFREYLRHDYIGKSGQQLSESTIQSRIGNCRTVEKYEGNLDLQFDSDGLSNLLFRLNYSVADQAAGKPLAHKIPINGDWRNGSATLKAAVALYQQYRNAGAAVIESTSEPVVTTYSTPPVPPKSSGWPEWPQLQSNDELALAKTVARFSRFLQPDIVRAVVEDNDRMRVDWWERLEQHGINPAPYLWSRSPCAFPGVRRYAGSTEIAIFRKRAEGSVTDALSLDDNDYPKHIWSFALTGKRFQKRGPYGYALAHLADHKRHKNRATDDFEIVGGRNRTDLDGLYTAPTNTAYLPVATIRPTDFSIPLRNLLLRHAAKLYGSFCTLLPPWLLIPQAVDSAWELDEFEWPEPVGDSKSVEPFLSFRRETMERLFERSSVSVLKKQTI